MISVFLIVQSSDAQTTLSTPFLKMRRNGMLLAVTHILPCKFDTGLLAIFQATTLGISLAHNNFGMLFMSDVFPAARNIHPSINLY